MSPVSRKRKTSVASCCPVASALLALYPPLPSHLLLVQPLTALYRDTEVKAQGHPSKAGQLGSMNGNLDLGSVLKTLCVA